MYMYVDRASDLWDPHSSVAEDSILVRYYAVSILLAPLCLRVEGTMSVNACQWTIFNLKLYYLIICKEDPGCTIRSGNPCKNVWVCPPSASQLHTPGITQCISQKVSADSAISTFLVPTNFLSSKVGSAAFGPLWGRSYYLIQESSFSCPL